MAWFRRSPSDKADRKERKRLRKAMQRKTKVLRITPPEGVPLDLTLATMGQRISAQLVDFFVTVTAAAIFVALMAYALQGLGNFLVIVAALSFFSIRVPYYVITEMVWNGRTLAKRWLGLRVVSTDGRSLSAYQIVARNLMKEVEFFAPLTYLLAGAYIHWSILVIAIVWTIILIIVPWRSKRTQRIGDIIANTAVIKNPEPLLLADISIEQTQEQTFIFSTAHLDQYGAYELQVLEQVLRAPPLENEAARKKARTSRADIVDRITRKIGYPEKIGWGKHEEFLQAFYTAQRAHLETRQQYGDARGDKYFREAKKQDETEGAA